MPDDLTVLVKDLHNRNLMQRKQKDDSDISEQNQVDSARICCKIHLYK